MCFHHKLFRKADELFLSSQDKKETKPIFQSTNGKQKITCMIKCLQSCSLYLISWIFTAFAAKWLLPDIACHLSSVSLCFRKPYKYVHYGPIQFHTSCPEKAEIWTIPCTELNLGQWDADWIDLIAFTWLDGDIFCWEISRYFVVIDWQSNSPALDLKGSWTLSSPVKVLWCAVMVIE